MDGIKKGVEENSVVLGGEEWGREVGEDSKGIVERDCGKG